MSFAAALHVVLVRFSKDDAHARDLVQLTDAGVGVGAEGHEPLVCVRRAVWGMLELSGSRLKGSLKSF